MSPSTLKKGFTLVETLVAISVLMLAVGAPLLAVSRSLSTSIYARDQVTAFYLAQDAIEYIRNTRDSNALVPVSPALDWRTNLTECVTDSCTVDTTNNLPADAIKTCITENVIENGLNYDVCNEPLAYDTAQHLYKWTGNTDSIFTRTVKIIEDPDIPDQLQVRVIISWRANNTNLQRVFVVQEDLLNWVH